MKPQPAQRRHSTAESAGFTLLELLISVALLGLLTVVLFGGLRFGARAWEAAESSADGADKILSAQAFIADEVSAAYPMFVRVSPEDAYVEFDGSPRSVTFLAPAKSPRGALEWVTIGTEEMNGARALAVWTALELRPGSPPRLSVVLLKGLKSFEIEYFGTDTPQDRPSWRRSWKGELTLPTLIRMHATFANSRVIWPDLVVATHISVDQGCIYDQLTHYCQGRI
jgi:general secretion pathway protein J